MTARKHRAPSVFGGELVLTVDGGEASLISNGTFLMSTATSRSERLLGALVATAPAPARVLIAGLGLGVTTTTVLADPDVAAVTVVEIEPALVQWWREELQPPVDDPRLTLVVDDVAGWLGRTDDTFDYICVDIDNGSEWLVDERNAALYSDPGIALVAGRLSDQGVATWWAARAERALADRLDRRFAEVRRLDVPVRRGDPDVIYWCRHPAHTTAVPA
ncbi:MAG TPA: hypothetical protein VG708_08150 [Mycobacteriales bacterium]|nr:hypothetical protein [Mycobacteriales bacterium]